MAQDNVVRCWCGATSKQAGFGSEPFRKPGRAQPLSDLPEVTKRRERARKIRVQNRS